jgi:hypothetical protein
MAMPIAVSGKLAFLNCQTNDVEMFRTLQSSLILNVLSCPTTASRTEDFRHFRAGNQAAAKKLTTPTPLGSVVLATLRHPSA